MDFKRLVKELRTKLIITQEELANLLGVSFASINRWETGKHEPTRAIIKRFGEKDKNGIIWHTQVSGKTALSAYANRVITDYFAKKNVKTIEYKSIGFKTTKHKVNRKLFCSKILCEPLQKNLEFKYKEEISFDKEKNEKAGKKAICIGYNPAKASKKIDTTNKRLIDLLWSDYDEYLLLNLYPQISTDQDTCYPEIDENANFEEVITEMLEKDSRDIILFWGRTTVFTESICEAIKKRIKKKLPLKMTVHQGKFTHPGSNADIQLQDIKEENILTSYRLE